MDPIKYIVNWKIGAFELSLVLFIFCVVTFQVLSSVVMLALTIGLGLAKLRFGGEFSLAQLYELLTGDTQSKKKETPTNG